MADKFLPLEVNTTTLKVGFNVLLRTKYPLYTTCLQSFLDEWPDTHLYLMFLISITATPEDPEMPVLPFGRMVCVVGCRSNTSKYKYSFVLFRCDDSSEEHLGSKLLRPVIDLFHSTKCKLMVPKSPPLDFHIIQLNNSLDIMEMLYEKHLDVAWVFLMCMLIVHAMENIEHKLQVHSPNANIDLVYSCLQHYDKVLLTRQYKQLFILAVNIVDWMAGSNISHNIDDETKKSLKHAGVTNAISTSKFNKKRNLQHLSHNGHDV